LLWVPNRPSTCQSSAISSSTSGTSRFGDVARIALLAGKGSDNPQLRIVAAAGERVAAARLLYGRLRLDAAEAAREKARAESELAATRERAPRMMVARLLGGETDETPSVEDAEDALKAATRAVEDATRARALLLEEEREAEVAIEFAYRRRADAITEVLHSAPEVAALWARYQAAKQNVRAIAPQHRTTPPTKLPMPPRIAQVWESPASIRPASTRPKPGAAACSAMAEGTNEASSAVPSANVAMIGPAACAGGRRSKGDDIVGGHRRRMADPARRRPRPAAETFRAPAPVW
jgi:hypothetical protein